MGAIEVKLEDYIDLIMGPILIAVKFKDTSLKEMAFILNGIVDQYAGPIMEFHTSHPPKGCGRPSRGSELFF